jgi:SAM-dependent methyltransferase
MFSAVGFLLVAIFGFTAIYAMVGGAPFVPMTRRHLADVMALAQISPGEKVVDLGSGDGRVLRAAARAGAQADGWEISPYFCLWSGVLSRLTGLGDRARTHLGSYWSESFHEADVVTIYLLPFHMARMAEKLKSELRPGTRVISVSFPFEDWQPEKTSNGVYLYRM